MTDEKRDNAEGQPIFCLLFALWAVRAKTFLADCQVSKDCSATLATAKCIQKEQPSTTLSCAGTEAINILRSLVPQSFNDLISKGELKEEEARATVAATKNLLRDSSQRTDAVMLHLEKLKELQMDFAQGRWNTEGFVSLDRSLELSIDYNVKVFSWLVSAPK